MKSKKRRKGMKRSIMLSILGIVVVLSITVGAFAQAKKEIGVKTVTIASGPVSGMWYPAGAKMGELFEKEFNLKVTVDIGGSAQNIRRVDAGRDADIGFASTPEVYNAYNGLAPFTKKHTNFNLMGCYTPYYYQVLVREGSGIHSWKDLKNKRFSPGNAGTGSEILSRNILEEVGLNYDMIRKAGGNIEFRDYAGSTEAMKDGNLDIMAASMNFPIPVYEEYFLRGKGYFLSVEESIRTKVSQKYPAYSPTDMPAGVYKGQNSPVPTFYYWSVFVVRADLPESVVYELTKATYKNDKEIRSLMAALKDFSTQNALKWSHIPVHPGAKKYFKEVGVWKD
jgi:TRAP transporter TAXI family solute receptor